MFIAPEIHSDYWKSLNLENPDSEDWSKAIEILKHRINCRYLEPVELLINEDEKRIANKRKYGFTVLAICCLLMETLQAFKEGLTDTKNKSERTVKNFLLNSPFFNTYFHDEPTAKIFYQHYRCGILHQAEVKENSLVWSIGDLRWENNGQQYINRTKVYEYLKLDFERYLSDLENIDNQLLRENFRKKMNFIARKSNA